MLYINCCYILKYRDALVFILIKNLYLLNKQYDTLQTTHLSLKFQIKIKNKFLTIYKY